jgi:hypothetical protein
LRGKFTRLSRAVAGSVERLVALTVEESVASRIYRDS